ncbi:hypothetical protein C8J57DRAFT_1475255, partial [Mycena rebaudengoi]
MLLQHAEKKIKSEKCQSEMSSVLGPTSDFSSWPRGHRHSNRRPRAGRGGLFGKSICFFSSRNVQKYCLKVRRVPKKMSTTPLPPLPSSVVLDADGCATCPDCKRKARDIGDLSQCLCGNSISSSDSNAVKCNRNGCETGWYCLPCTGLHFAVQNWTCLAYASSASTSRLPRAS